MLLADRYAEMRDSTRVHERTLFPPQRNPSELELQARCIDAALDFLPINHHQLSTFNFSRRV
jgi:hypothetical protein